MDTSPPEPVSGSLVLLVDDDDAVVFAFSKQLGKLGISVASARTLDHALDRLGQYHYNLVITDLRLTGSDSEEGMVILEYVHQHCPSTVTVLMTGHATEATFEKARAAGAAVCLTKPVTREMLRATLESIGFV